jgi:HEAT repeat protein
MGFFTGSLPMSSSLDFLMSLQWALKSCRLYGVSHPRNQESLKGLEAGYQRFLSGKSQVQIATRSGKMFVDKVMEDIQNLQIKAFANEMEERGIYAILLYPGATREELQTLLSLLCLKPAQLREQGGAKKLLEEKGVTHLRIVAVRLEEVSEAGEIASALLASVAAMGSGSGMRPGGAAGMAGPGAGTSTGSYPVQGSSAKSAYPTGSSPTPPRGPAGQGYEFNTLVTQMRDYFISRISGGVAPDLSGLGTMLQSLGMDQQGVQPNTQGAIRQALSSMAAEQQIELFRGAAMMHTGALRNLFARLAATMAAPSFAAAYARGSMAPERIPELADQLKPLSTSAEHWGEQLANALRREGMSEGQLRDLLDIITWDNQTASAKLAKLLDGQRIFEIPQEKVLAFMREMLEAGRFQEFQKVMRHYASGLTVPAVARRTMVAKGFEKIADWADIPGMPAALLNELMELLSRTYGREKDPEVHQWLSKAVEHILWFWVESGDPEKAFNLFSELQDVVTEMSLPAPWKSAATADLLLRLGAPDRVHKVLAQLFTMDRQEASARIHPYLRMLGPAAANYLVERLADESDRSRRAHLLDALKACGQVAEAPLLESLKSEEWFVVRNALIVLGEITGQQKIGDLIPYLRHGDARVRIAAIRTVGRIGGRQAEAALIPQLAQKDPNIQMELLFILDEMRTKQAVPALIDLVKNGRGKLKSEQEKVREKAVEVLGHMESASAIPVLEELISRRRSFFRETKESLEIRAAALKALLHLDSQEAQEVIHRVLDEEPKGAEKDALDHAFTEALTNLVPKK